MKISLKRDVLIFFRLRVSLKTLKHFIALFSVCTGIYVITFLQYNKQRTTTSPEENPNLTSRLAAVNAALFSEKNNTANESRMFVSGGACAIPVDLMKESHMADSEGCKITRVDPFHSDMMRIVQPVTINCPGRLFTEYQNNVLRILDDVNEGL